MRPLLTFPFNQAHYDAGAVVRVDREALRYMVHNAALRAKVSEEDRLALIEAVSKRDVATVAVGLYKHRRVPNCECPAYLAGFVHLQPVWDIHLPDVSLGHDERIINFPLCFDREVTRLYPHAQVLEIIDEP